MTTTATNGWFAFPFFGGTATGERLFTDGKAVADVVATDKGFTAVVDGARFTFTDEADAKAFAAATA